MPPAPPSANALSGAPRELALVGALAVSLRSAGRRRAAHHVGSLHAFGQFGSLAIHAVHPVRRRHPVGSTFRRLHAAGQRPVLGAGRLDRRIGRLVGIVVAEIGGSRIDGVVAGHDMGVAAVDVQLLSFVALVARLHVHRAVVDDELRLDMEGIVARFDIERAARQQALEVGVQRVVHRSDGDVATRDTQVGLRMDAVVAGLDDERSAVDGHESLRGFRILVRLDAVAARDQREVAVRDLDAVASAQRVFHRVHHIGAARDHKVVLRAHRMAVRAGHRQGSRSVQREVGTAEQRGVRLVGAVFEHVFRAVGERVLRPVGQRDEALVGLLHVHGGPVLVVDGRAREDDLHLRVLRRLHRQLPVVERTRHHVDALGRDGHRGAVNRRAIALHAGRPPAQHDMHGGSIVVRSIRIALAVVEIECRRVESRRNLGKRSSLARVGSRPERVRLTPINGHPSSRPPAPQIRRTPRQGANPRYQHERKRNRDRLSTRRVGRCPPSEFHSAARTV